MIDPDVAAIENAMKAQAKPRAELGRLLGLDGSQIHRLFAGKRRLQRHEYNKAMEWLGLSIPQVTGGLVVPLPGMVPLYGWVGAASESRLTIAEQSLRGYVPIHPNQAQVRDAFALEVSDISMAPRYEPGEIVYLAPNRWPTRGQDCVLVTNDGHGFIKRYVSRDLQQVHLYQLNPEGAVDFNMADVEAIHTVVGRG